MKTKQRFLMKSAFAVAATVALAGCVKEKVTPEVPCELKFVLNVTSPNDTYSETRALKQGWANGDKIVVFFNGNTAKYVTYTYNSTTTDWDWTNNTVNVGDLATGDTAQALHAGTSTFGTDGTTISGIGGDLLYDIDGEVFIDGAQAIWVTITLDRGFTTAIKMDGSTTQTDNDNWRLAGENLWVMGTTTDLTVNTGTVSDFGAALQGLFVQSSVDGTVATPDAAFTDATQAVFHVWDKDDADTSTSFSVYDNSEPDKVYTRTYPNDLAVGATVLIAGPDDSTEGGQWTEVSTDTPVSGTPVALGGVAAPAAGAAPAVFSDITGTGTEFSATALTWSPAATTFQAGTAYTATITLTAVADKTFTGSGFTTDDTASVAGFTVGGQAPTGVTNNGGTLVLTYTFPATAAKATAAGVTVTAPVAGAAPSATVTETSDQFDGTVAWDPADNPFVNDGSYTATVTLTAVAGNTFATDYTDDATITGFTINGNAPTWVSNDGATLVFKYTFPAVYSNLINYGPDEADVEW